jgi:hypothetical protein
LVVSYLISRGGVRGDLITRHKTVDAKRMVSVDSQVTGR